ncbi:MAG TPA: ATP-binding protein [bacterium]|nr:ATP-binding protein [bacterium]
MLRGVLDAPAGRLWRDLVEALASRPPSGARVARAFGRLFTLLAGEAELAREPLVGDAWQHHLLGRLVGDENPFSLKAERAGRRAIGPALLRQTQADLAALERCYRVDGAAIARGVARLTGALPPSWKGFHPLSTRETPSARRRMMRRIAAARGWSRIAGELADYFAVHGVGLFAWYRAFRWIHDGDGRGHLEGVAEPDPVRLDDLVEYEEERQPVVDNTRQFVAGLPANNVLLYGDRGTGKSSTVKALLTEFQDQGLRLIEVAKEHLAEYPQIVAPLRTRRERFILFVDDLSFEEHETQYKALKAALEGSVEAHAENVVLYATSNRRRLVRERFGDRRGPVQDDDVHVEETVQEKLSLADRFGIHVPFLIPDQDRYLEIATALAARYGIRLPHDEIRRRALLWSHWHNGHSCRTARQFVDALRGELALSSPRGSRPVRLGRARRPR